MRNTKETKRPRRMSEKRIKTENPVGHLLDNGVYYLISIEVKLFIWQTQEIKRWTEIYLN